MALAVALACVSCQTAGADAEQTGRSALVQLTADAAKKHKVPTEFALALVEVESSFQPGVVSQGNYGLGQIRCGTAKGLGYRGKCRGLLDPKTNLTYSMEYLRLALDAADDDHCRAAMLYNQGLNARVGKRKSAYCKKVLAEMADGG